MEGINLQDYQNLLRASIDAKLSTMDSTFSNSIGLKLTRDRLLVWLNEPASITLNISLLGGQAQGRVVFGASLW